MDDREVFKQVNGKWVLVGRFSGSKAFQLIDQLKRQGIKCRSRAVPYLTGFLAKW